MNKKAILISCKNKLIEVSEVKSFTDETEYARLREEAKKNKEDLFKSYDESISKLTKLGDLRQRLCKVECRLLLIEIKLLKGDIDEELYIERKGELQTSKDNILNELEVLDK